MDKYFELYKPGGWTSESAERISRANQRAKLNGRVDSVASLACSVDVACAQRRGAAVQAVPRLGCRHTAFPCPSPPAGGGAAGGFIRVAISFLEPDQVRLLDACACSMRGQLCGALLREAAAGVVGCPWDAGAHALHTGLRNAWLQGRWRPS